MKKSIKNLEAKSIKNVKSVKGGTELEAPRGPRYIARGGR
jgi:hypothetical protein